MSELPKGWKLARLDELCEWGSGGKPRRSEPSYFGGEFPWITISDLNDGVVSSTAESLTEAGILNSAAKLVPENTILVVLYGSIGKLGITKQLSTTNQAIACALPHEQAVWRDLKDGLANLLHDKCWYCETAVDRSDNAVDHFRPKGRVSDAANPHAGLPLVYGQRWLLCMCANPHAQKDPQTRLNTGFAE